MKESTATRVGRIISGSVNALIDSIENSAPDMLMEQTIREIDDAIGDIRSELGNVVAQKHLASSRLAEETHRQDELVGKIEFAVSQGRDDLAEAAISQQLDIEAQIPILKQNIAEFAGREQELEGFINALQAKKRDMREELKQLQVAKKAAEQASRDSSGVSASGSSADKVDKALAAFERIMQNQKGYAKTEGHNTPDTAAKMAELEALSHSNRIRERLKKIKAGIDQ